MLLQNKVVIISGIGPGLGTSLALEAARQGASLAICARTESKLAEAEQQIAALGLDTAVLSVSTDIANRDACKNLVAKTVEKYGRIDVLINSAFNPGSFDMTESADLDGWRAAMDVNFFGTVALTLEVIPHMKQHGGGSIVMINTMVTRVPMPTQAGYGASKAALSSATQHFAEELGPYNIRVNSCFMGWMWGPSVQGHFEYVASQGGASVEEQKKAVEQHIPLRRMPPDSECAKAAIFFASDYSGVVTGAQLDVNGGEFLPH